MNKKLEKELNEIQYSAMFMHMLEKNNYKIWVVENKVSDYCWYFSYARSDARECSKDNENRTIKRYSFLDTKRDDKIYVLIDTCNKGQGVYDDGYMFIFKDYVSAVRAKKKFNSNENYVDVIGPYSCSRI